MTSQFLYLWTLNHVRLILELLLMALFTFQIQGFTPFISLANDGCQLKINGEEQFESDGRKSIAFEQKYIIDLSQGYHQIDIGFYQCSDRIKLEVEWEGSFIKRQNIPTKVFYHTK